MLRKLLIGAVAVAGLMFVGTPSVDAGWRRAYRQGYYAPYNDGYYYRAPRRAYRAQYYNYGTPYYYGYSTPGYYYNSGGYYQQPYYGGVGISTPGFGLYIR